VPRIIFGSEHGFSQIIISQISFALNVKCSPDWQLDINLGRKYLIGKAPLLFNLLSISGASNAFFCGLSTQVHISSSKSEEDVISHLVHKFLKDEYVQQFHDLEIKRTHGLEQRFFSNITISNFRVFEVEAGASGILGLSRDKTVDKGVSVLGDFNDRYSFNENNTYRTQKNHAEVIIIKGIEQISNSIRSVQEI